MRIIHVRFRIISATTLILFAIVISKDFSLACGDFSLPLTLTNSSGISHNSEPITSGVPLSESLDVTKLDELVVTKEDGTPVPAQFRILARYGPIDDTSKPIKWVLADFQADVSAKGSSVYYLKRGTQRAASGISTTVDETKIVVNTGAMTLTIPRSNFNLFSSVTLAGHSAASITGDSGAGIIIEKKGEIYSSYYDDSPTVSIEESGPLRTVIKAKGKFQSVGGEVLVGGDARMYRPKSKIAPKAEGYPITFTVRIHAYKRKSYVKIIYTLENDGNTINSYYPVNDVFIDGNYVKIKPSNLRGQLIGTTPTAAFPINFFDSFNLFQHHKLVDEADESKNFLFTVRRNNRQMTFGKRSDGWMEITDSADRGLTLGMRYFWQNYEKEFAWKDGYLQLGVLPDHDVIPETGGYFTHYSTGNHYFSGGWHKTTELLLYVSDGTLPLAEIQSQVNRFNNPLFAKCNKEWYADSKAWSLIAPSRFSTAKDSWLRDALNRYEDYIGMFVDDAKDVVRHLTIEKLRETRGWRPKSRSDWYGWENFGDMSTGSNLWSPLVYDWPYSFWLHYMRTNDHRYSILAKEATDHHIDLDLVKIHGEGAAGAYGDGTWMWEIVGGEIVNNHHKSSSARGFALSHTWNGGYTLGYLLTGDYRYWEAAQRTANAARRWYSRKRRDCINGQSYIYTQTRSQGWSILALVNEYRVNGNMQNLRDAMNIFVHSLLYMEQLPECPGSDGKGYILHKSDNSNCKGIVTFLTYPLEPLCELHYEAAKTGMDVSSLESYLQRSLNWLKNYAFVGGKYNDRGLYSLLTISYATDPLNRENNLGGTLAHNIHVAGAFGYMSKVLKSKNPSLAADYLDFARNLFKDLMLYKAAGKKTKNDYINPESYSSVSWGWLPTMPKEMGFIGRGGQFYLHAEYDEGRSRNTPKSKQPHMYSGLNE